MTEIIFECEGCGSANIENVNEKTTSVCRHCEWPTDVMEDGSTVTSPLALCRGWVTADRGKGFGMGLGKGVRTLEDTLRR